MSEGLVLHEPFFFGDGGRSEVMMQETETGGRGNGREAGATQCGCV